jgi:hypothetical protein
MSGRRHNSSWDRSGRWFKSPPGNGLFCFEEPGRPRRSGSNPQGSLTFFDNAYSIIFRLGLRPEDNHGKDRKDLGERKSARVDLQKSGFLIPAPEAPWIECQIVNVSEGGVRLDVGALAVPEVFGLAFTADGGVIRVCSPTWRRGKLVGARFLTASELRRRFVPAGETDQTALAV